MYFAVVRPNCLTFFRNIKRHSSVVARELEYSEQPEYPPILDVSIKAKRERVKGTWHEKIKSLRTVEEKLMEVNMPKYYGWNVCMLMEDEVPFNSLSLAQYVTRTHFSKCEDLPSFYSSSGIVDNASNVLENIKSEVQSALVYEYHSRRRKHEYFEDENYTMTPRKLDEIFGRSVLTQINRIILANLSSKLPHLLRSQVDYDPRVESFWFVGGFEPTLRVRKMRRGSVSQKDKEEEPVDRAFQYLGSPILHIRSELPLLNVVDFEESYNADFKVPVFHYDPRVLGFRMKHRHGTNIPGFWPGDSHEFGFLSFHHRGHLLDRLDSFGDIDQEEALHVQAILASYGWLFPQACYQGFSTYNDVTYPFVTQTVISNGQYWSFYVYQLNTTLLHSHYAAENPRRNLCWGTGTMKLFESVENGQVVGFNDDVLKKLLAFYLNAPSIREGYHMKPYLGGDVQHLADISDQEERIFLEKSFKHMYSNRPRHRLPYEIYHWEKIYKIDNKTRFMEARRRPFELGINPHNRRYDEHTPSYIPKAVRDEKQKKQKWAKTYYP
ncbi:large ribosomal subunit protein mL65 [Anabrus simplex]|uniref:large ribosomal subunit protein mL65 n=1 Tax=Anabrus simplex TaxID=316456 RepID=UPI0035A3213A